MPRLALLLPLALAGCLATPPGLCSRGWKLAHPTMTPDEITTGAGARVHAVSEGATGQLGQRVRLEE
jgi:hypothetical protein